MKWRDLTTGQIGNLDRRTPVFLNIAAIEQHGPHLPLATDAIIGEHFLTLLDAELGDRVLILPQVEVGCSAHHLDFAGTLSVTHSSMLSYVGDIVDSIRQSGFTNIVILNSHGGNQGIGQVLNETLGQRASDCRIVFATWWQLAADRLAPLSDGDRFSVGHACEFETSLMMAIAPDLVTEPIPEGTSYQHAFAWSDGGMLNGPRASLYRSIHSISGGSGIVGTPSLASAKKGKAIAREVCAALIEVVNDLAE